MPIFTQSLTSITTGLEVQEGPYEMNVDFVFNTTLAIFAEELPSPMVQLLASHARQIIADGYCKLGALIPVPELTFALTKGPRSPIPMIMVPFDWSSRVQESPLPEMGRIVSVCSNMLDYFNDRYLGQPDFVRRRARAFEAEFVLRVLDATSDDYFIHSVAEAALRKVSLAQEQILNEYPDGLSTPSIKSLLYTFNPFISLVD